MTDKTQDEMPAITADKLQAVVLLVEGQPKTKVAEAVGIHRDTLYEWLKLPEFQKALEVHQRRVAEVIMDPTAYQAGLVKWKAGLPEMMEALLKTACDPSNARQATAAKIILEAVTPDQLNTGPTDDERIIDEWLKANGISQIQKKVAGE